MEGMKISFVFLWQEERDVDKSCGCLWDPLGSKRGLKLRKIRYTADTNMFSLSFQKTRQMKSCMEMFFFLFDEIFLGNAR